MRHRRNADFRVLYLALPPGVRKLADKQSQLLKKDHRHPSLHFKRAGPYWTVRVGLHYRPVALEPEQGVLVWFWIGTHHEYDRLIQGV